ncbi:CID domain-containing protein 1 [Thelohanellus kitauei]|uniref:CID domain-containing protein 1 n=1 Tax=Thelohanellus kitauei TaxID=669202 RepID=A0A0C2J8B2_THEKT|nr:CID domain-containing protein 1 [Thelohanellus kitauei]
MNESIHDIEKKMSTMNTSRTKIIYISGFFTRNTSEFQRLVKVWRDCFLRSESAETRLGLLYVVHEVIMSTMTSCTDYHNEFDKYLVECITKCYTSGDFTLEKCPHYKLFRIWVDKKIFKKPTLKAIQTMWSKFKEASTPEAQKPQTALTTPISPAPKEEELRITVSKLIGCPSDDTKRKNAIQNMGNPFQDPERLLKPYVDLISCPDIIPDEEFNGVCLSLDSMILKLQSLEETLSLYSGDLEKELATRKSLDQMLECMEKNLLSQEMSLQDLCRDKKVELRLLEKRLSQEKSDETV